jgi:hypothetical protein
MTTDYDSVYYSFNLNTLTFATDSVDPMWCVSLSDNKDESKKTAFCVHPGNLNPSKTP